MFDLSALPESLARTAPYLRDALLVLLLLLAAWTDWREFRIPNWLTLSGLGIGLAYNASAAPAAIGVLPALGGAAVGLAILLPLWMLRAMGAGDVKLMAAVGAFLGYPDILPAALFSFVAGGAAALGIALWRQVLGRAALNVGDMLRATAVAVSGGPRVAALAMPSVGRLPFGLCVCAGTFAWIALKQWR
jgi:prepilin peptidase CpaA